MAAPPRSILFVCNLNTIRSPMAEGLARRLFGGRVMTASCGLWEGGYLDGFMVRALEETGVDMSEHAPRTLEEVDPDAFDMIVALTPQSHARLESLAVAKPDLDLVFWPLPDPTRHGETSDARMEAYRTVRDAIAARLAERFPAAAGGSDHGA